MIKKCDGNFGKSCVSDYQDKLYGKGIRVHTTAKDGTHRCTVCGPSSRKQQRLKLHADAHIKKIHG